MIKENISFIREALQEFEKTGTLFPTSPWAARALTIPLHRRNGPMHILELGPGNGPVTVQILKQMVDGDTLTICEINPRFMRALKNRLRKDPIFRARKHQVKFFTCAAQELPEDVHFDVIICALPFLNFDLKTVEEIFAKIKRLAARNAVMTYYEYIGIRPLSIVFSPPQRKRRMKELDGFFDLLKKEHPVSRRPVWLNVLPIQIYKVELAA